MAEAPAANVPTVNPVFGRLADGVPFTVTLPATKVVPVGTESAAVK